MNVSDIPTLLKVNNFIQILVYVLGGLALVLQITKFIISNRISTLKSQKEEVVETKIEKLDSSVTQQFEILDEQNEIIKDLNAKSSGSIMSSFIYKNIFNEVTRFPKFSIRIMSTIGCPQCNTLASEFENLFNQAGWEVIGETQVLFEKNNFGIVVLIRDNEVIKKGPNLLITLIENGFVAQLELKPDIKEDFQLIVTKNFASTSITEQYLRKMNKVYDKLKFSSIGDSHLEESKNYEFTGNEIFDVFSDQDALWKHYKPSFDKHDVLNIKLHRFSDLRTIFWPLSKEKNSWMLKITKSKYDKLLVPEKLLDILANREPMNNK